MIVIIIIKAPWEEVSRTQGFLFIRAKAKRETLNFSISLVEKKKQRGKKKGKEHHGNG